MTLHYLDPDYKSVCDYCDFVHPDCGESPEVCKADSDAAWADAHNDMIKEDGPYVRESNEMDWNRAIGNLEGLLSVGREVFSEPKTDIKEK